MTEVTVDLLTYQGNAAVVRLRERKYPGVLVQGDTLANYLVALTEIGDALQRGDTPEAASILQALSAELLALKDAYETALRTHGLPLPY